MIYTLGRKNSYNSLGSFAEKTGQYGRNGLGRSCRRGIRRHMPYGADQANQRAITIRMGTGQSDKGFGVCTFGW